MNLKIKNPLDPVINFVDDKLKKFDPIWMAENGVGGQRTRYYDQTGRRISFEYAMINGVNDTEEAAKILLKRLRGMGAHMNLIPLNHVEESPLKPSTKGQVARFQKILEDGGVTATVRRTLGGDIDASCGQLRRKYNQETK
mgnify:CR=1 FL=1